MQKNNSEKWEALADTQKNITIFAKMGTACSGLAPDAHIYKVGSIKAVLMEGWDSMLLGCLRDFRTVGFRFSFSS